MTHPQRILTGLAAPGLLVASLLLGSAAAQAQAPAGVTAAVNPQATGTPPALPTRVLEVGADVVQNERVSTGPEGQAQLLFRDGTTLTLGPGSDLTIDNFVYDPQRDTARMALTAATGVFRLVGGRATKDEPVTITTPTATIGIRGGINYTVVGAGGETETSQAFGKDTSATSRSTGETQTISRSGFTLSVRPNQAITVAKIDIDKLKGMLAGLQGSPGRSGGASSAPDQNSPAAKAVSTVNADQPVSSFTGGGLLANSIPASLAVGQSYNTTAVTSSQQTTTVGSVTTSLAGVSTIANAFSGLASGQYNLAGTAPSLTGFTFGSSTFPSLSFTSVCCIRGAVDTNTTSTISAAPGFPASQTINTIDTASGSNARDFTFTSNSVDLSGTGSRTFTRVTASTGALQYTYTLNYSIQRSLTGGTLAEVGGDSQAAFVRVTGASIRTAGTATLTASGPNLPSSIVPGTVTFGPETVTYGANQSLHLILGTPATSLPNSGQYAYSLVGATSPTFTDGSGSPGKFAGTMQILFGQLPTRLYTSTSTGAPLAVNFSGSVPGYVVGLNGTVTMPNDATYAIATIGGASNPSQQLSQNPNTTGLLISDSVPGQPYRFSGSGLVSTSSGAKACPSGSCSATLNGVLIGAGGTRAGLVYYIGSFQGSTPAINGVVLFRR